MTYDTFIKELTSTLTCELGPSYHLRLNRLMKNNDTYRESLVILAEGENVSPAFCLGDCYKMYQNGEDVREISRQILEMYRSDHIAKTIDMDFLLDWDRVRDRIVCRLIGAGRNRERLQSVLHRRVLDMAVIYRYEFETDRDYTASLIIENDLAGKWGVSPAQIDEAARENTKKLLPPLFQTMEQIMADLMGDYVPGEQNGNLFVLTNEKRMHGAYWFSDGDVLEDIRQKIGDGFLILPSSVHECMIIPEGMGPDPKELALMVREINRREVAPDEVLTDSVYRYRRETGLQIEVWQGSDLAGTS